MDSRPPQDEEAEDIFASPPATKSATLSSSTAAQRKQSSARLDQDTQEAREAQLRAELNRIREVNTAIEGVIDSLNKARNNMGTVKTTVENASTLLGTWTRILSQTEHNQRLILNPAWHGASQDLEDMESEELRRQQEVERQEMEEQRRKEEAQRRAAEEERKKASSAAAALSRGVNRTRSLRGSASRGAGRVYSSTIGQAGRGRGAASDRGTSGIGRGSSLRGRGRGLG